MVVDTHCHLGGSVPLSFVWDTIKTNGWKHLAESEEEVKRQMTFSVGEKYDFHVFLSKFKILDEFKWTEQLIDDSIKAVCDVINHQKIDYTFMDFSINKYMSIGWHKRDAIKFIYDSFSRYAPHKVGLILSLKYESMRASQRQYASLIDNGEIADYLVGIDLVGDEMMFDSAFYEPIFKSWNDAGKLTRAHVGESQSVGNIIDAMGNLRCTNIAHGFKIMQNASGLDWAIDNGICFDMAITSNYLTGVLHDQTTHPIVDMHRKGVLVTLGSDDQVQCSSTLKEEFVKAGKLGLSVSECNKIRQNAVDLYERYRLFR